MANFRPFFEYFLSFFSSKRAYPILAGIILGIFFLYLVKGCTDDQSNKTTFYIGQDSRWTNLQLMGNERNVAPFNNQLLAAVAKQSNMHLVVVITPASDLLAELEQGRLQGILTALQPSYLHEERLLFSEPYYLIGPVLIIPLTAPVEGWNEMGKKIVGIPPKSPILSSLEQDPTIQTKIYYDILPALADLSERRIDGAIFPAIPAITYVKTFYKNELKIATLPLTEEGIRLVTQKNDEGKELIKQFNQAIFELKKSGEFDALLNRWGLVNPEKIVPNH